MATHNLKSRIMQKSDIEANWKKATNFTPLEGEIIVYEVDDNNPKPRIKIGNGSTTVNNLPFINDALFINFTGEIPEGTYSQIFNAYSADQQIFLRTNIVEGAAVTMPLLAINSDMAMFIANIGPNFTAIAITSTDEIMTEEVTFITSEELDDVITNIDNNIDQKADKTELVGLASQSYVNTQISAIDFPVDSVNGKTGAVSLSAADLSAYTKIQTNEKIAADINTHNTSTTAHDDIRVLIDNLKDKVNKILNSSDEDLDQLSEIVKYIKDNRELVDAINSNKIAVTDIIDNLTSTEAAKPLSANQGRELKALIDNKVTTSVYNKKVEDLESSIGQKLNTTTFTQYQSTNDGAIEDINTALGQKANASDVETQLAGKADQTTVDTKLNKTAGTASRVIISDANKNITTSSISTTKLGYLTDVTSNIQAQIDAKASIGSVTDVKNIVDNLKNFSKITVGSTNIEPNSNAGTLTFTAGSGITLTGDATNDKITIAAKIDDSLSTTSTNPVQNKVINSALAEKLNRITGSPEGHLTYVNSSGQLESSEVTEETLVDAFTSYSASAGSIQNQLDNKASKATATTEANGLMSSTDKTKLDNTNIAYGTCSTTAGTIPKVITISGNTNWVLAAGSMITVLFDETNTAENPTFNVNGTGVKNVFYGNSQITTSNLSYAGYKSRPMNFMYDGTQYRFIGWGMDTDTKVQQDAAITTAGEYPVILAYSTSTSKVTNTVKKTSTLKYNPSTKILTAPTFKGNLDGTAAKATADASGNNIADTYATKSALDILDDQVEEIGQTVEGHTESINSLINNKQDANVSTANRVLVSDNNGRIAVSATVTSTELNQLDGINTNQTIQAQLNAKADQNTYDTKLAGKVDKVEGKGLSTNDFTNAYKTKLDNAEANQNAFSTIAVKANSSAAATNIAADSKTDTFTVIGGSNITLTPSTSDGSLTIAAAYPSSAGTSLGLVKSGGDVTISDGTITVKDDSHSHSNYALGTTVSAIDSRVENLEDNIEAIQKVVDISANGSANTIDTISEIIGYIQDNKDAISIITNKQDKNLGSGSASKVLVTDASGNITASSNITTTELEYLDGLTSPIKTQFENLVDNKASKDVATTSLAGLMSADDKAKLDGIADEANKTTVATSITSNGTDPVTSKAIYDALSGKQTTITGAASTIASSNLTKDRALVSNASGKVAVSSVTSTELGYLSGVTDNIQTQLGGKVNQNTYDTAMANKVDKDGTKVLSTNDFTDDLKEKLDGIAENANNYSLPTASSSTKGGVKTGAAITNTSGYTAVHIKDGVIYYKDSQYTLGSFGITATADQINGTQNQIDTLNSNKVDKDGNKVLSTNDYTTAEKEKLAGIDKGAEVNQNAFGKVTVGSTTITADAKVGTLTLAAGTGVTLTPDATNDKITIAVTTDTALNATSTNPVQNKVINTKFENITNTIEDIQETLNLKANQSALETTNTTVATKQDKTVDSANVVLVSNSDKNISTSPITTTQLGYLTNVTSDIQAQINAKASSTDLTNLQSSFDTSLANGLATKQNTITGAATSIASSNLTASRALISNSSGKVAVSAVTSTELGYLDGVTSNIQTQLTNLENTKVTSANAITAEQIMALCGTNVYSATGRSF